MALTFFRVRVPQVLILITIHRLCLLYSFIILAQPADFVLIDPFFFAVVVFFDIVTQSNSPVEFDMSCIVVLRVWLTVEPHLKLTPQHEACDLERVLRCGVEVSYVGLTSAVGVVHW